jgi:hypothetical protein
MSNAEGMKLLAEFIAKHNEEFRWFLLHKVNEAELLKTIASIESNLEILSEGGDLSGGV